MAPKPSVTYLTLAQARVPDDENMRIAPCGYFAVPTRAPEQPEDQPSLLVRRESRQRQEIKVEEIRRVVGAASTAHRHYPYFYHWL